MRDKSWQRNTTGLVAAAQRRAAATRARVQLALEALLREGTPITFQAVARTAQVTKAYLYQHPAIRERIEYLRAQTVPSRSARSASTRSDKSASVLLAAKDRRITQLEAENRQLKAELQGALAQLYERL